MTLKKTTDCILITAADQKLMYVNHASKAVLGVTPEQALGQPILPLLFTLANDAKAVSDSLCRQGHWHGEVQARRDGKVVDITITAVGGDDITALVAIVRDMTAIQKVATELETRCANLQLLVDQHTVELRHEIAEKQKIQNQLNNALREKELLLKEAHHRIKNNMQVISSLLNIQADKVEDALLTRLLRECQQRIKSIALIHENLYQSQDLQNVNCKDYIRMLMDSLLHLNAMPGHNIKLDIQTHAISLDMAIAAPCGLIINELVSNAFQHAFKGKCRGMIKVSFRAIEHNYVLEVHDDGAGLPNDFNLESSSMGMEIVSILTDQLGGKLKFGNANGAHFQITFPR